MEYQQKFVMNLTTLNRNSYESKVNNIVGDFTSINLLAVDFSIQKSFREYVKQIQQQLLTDMEHKFFLVLKYYVNCLKAKRILSCHMYLLVELE